MTYCAPASLACSSEMSPVYAPLPSALALCIANAMRFPLYRARSSRKKIAGGATMSVMLFADSAALRFASKSLFASRIVGGFIFQLAMTMDFIDGLYHRLFSNNHPSEVGGEFGRPRRAWPEDSTFFSRKMLFSQTPCRRAPHLLLTPQDERVVGRDGGRKRRRREREYAVVRIVSRQESRAAGAPARIADAAAQIRHDRARHVELRASVVLIVRRREVAARRIIVIAAVCVCLCDKDAAQRKRVGYNEADLQPSLCDSGEARRPVGGRVGDVVVEYDIGDIRTRVGGEERHLPRDRSLYPCLCL